MNEHEVRWTADAVKAIVSQFIGFMMDGYDLLLVTAMTNLLAKVFLPPSTPAWLSYFQLLFGYAFTLIGRPVGSAIFGNLGDKIGRRDTLIITIAGFSAMSALTGALPTYAQIGISAYIIFSAMRFIQGIFIGGEYAVGHTFSMEYAPIHRRGLASGIVQGAFSWGTALSAGVVAAFYALLGDQAMLSYGWRLVFLTGLIPAAVALYIRFGMKESPLFENIKTAGKVEKAPFFSIFKPPTLYTFLQVFVLMTGLFFSSYSLFNYANGILTGAGLSGGQAAFYYSMAGIFAAIAATFTGFISDYIGRRKAFLIAAAVTFVMAVPTFYLWYIGAKTGNLAYLWIGTVLAGWMTQWPWGLVPTYLSERFPTNKRSSGVGFGYSSGLFISAWMSIYSIWLAPVFKPIQGYVPWFTAAFFLMLASVLYGIAAAIGPETKGIRLSEI